MIGKLTLLLLVVAFANGNPAFGSQHGRITAFNRRTHINHHDGGDANIAGGKEAVPHSYPFQVYTDEGGSTCGGVLISDEWVLTSGDCASQGSQIRIKVVLGAHNIEEEEPTQVVMTATESYVPDTYGFLVDDIGLIKLPEKVTFDDNIQPAKLPTKKLDPQSSTVTGWGIVDEEGYLYSDVLMEGEANVVSISVCESYYGDVEPDTICVDARAGGAAFCDGDFGAPLHIDGTVYGVAIYYATAGCQSGGPEGFTEVFDYLDWIEEISGVVP